MNERIFIQNIYQCEKDSVEQLIKLTKDKREAEEYVLSAITDIWSRMVGGKLKHQSNLCGLLYTVAKNNWLKTQKKSKKMNELGDDILGKLEAETPFEFDLYSKDAIRRQAMKNAFEGLGKKCKLLLQRFIVDKEKLKNLVDELDYGSYDSIRASKLQCTRHLERNFAIELDKLR